MNDANASRASEFQPILDALSSANARFARRYPGESSERQPVHTVYGGAQLFRYDIATHLGERAITVLDEYAPDPFTFAHATGMVSRGLLPARGKDGRALAKLFEKDPKTLRDEHRDAWLACTVYERVRQKLIREPVEDFRIDFEDGFGVRPDAEEDRAAIHAAEEVARGAAEGTLPPFLGIRIKPLNEEMKQRATRTLDLFFTTLAERTDGTVPRCVVTLPKVPVPEHVNALVRMLERIEQRVGLARGALKLELMIELTQSIFAADGTLNLPKLLDAADGRCIGAHFGTYDYTASCGITAPYQEMRHPAAQLALGLMKIAFANTGIFLSDGATNVLPVPIHRSENGKLKRKERRANEAAIFGAWGKSFDNVWSSLENAFYQGWDLHPAQLPVRYAANYAFFLSGFDRAAARLANFVDKAAQATMVGEVFDDAATGQGLLNYFLRALSCGAVSLEELAVTGLSVDEIKTRSFVRILEGRTR
jgi:citrate lyase beta subunit